MPDDIAKSGACSVTVVRMDERSVVALRVDERIDERRREPAGESVRAQTEGVSGCLEVERRTGGGVPVGSSAALADPRLILIRRCSAGGGTAELAGALRVSSRSAGGRVRRGVAQACSGL